MRLDATRCALVVLAAIAAGCAVTGQPFQRQPAPSGEAEIYIYRPYNYAGSLLRPPVVCGDSVARLGPGGYQVFKVQPGTVTCHTETETADEVEFETRPGGVYYLKEDIGWGLSIGHPHLYPMDTDKAVAEIQTCCVLEPGSIVEHQG